MGLILILPSDAAKQCRFQDFRTFTSYLSDGFPERFGGEGSTVSTDRVVENSEGLVSLAKSRGLPREEPPGIHFSRVSFEIPEQPQTDRLSFG